MIDPLLRFDAWLYRMEKRVVATMLLVMGLVVFCDVVYRVSATAESPLVPDAIEGVLGAAAVPMWAAIVGSFVGVLAMRTRGEDDAALKGVAVGWAFALLIALYIWFLPSGLVWSQTLALSLTLWMGMSGACLAAYQRRHLALDIGSKLWPPSMAPKAAAIGHFLTAGFCVLVLVLGWRSIFGVGEGETRIPGHLDTWTDSDMAAGTMTGTVIPKWFVMFSIPFGAAVLAFRFALQGVQVWSGREGLGGDDTLRQLGLEDEVAS
ncbi:MAG: TRAP transporter small permease [Myxococcales bacterium]|nr:TRAP transporter small permease [Myxococcales bacterium]